MTKKNKAEKSPVVLVHYREPSGVHHFRISDRKNIEKVKLELMLAGMEDIKTPALEWEKAPGEMMKKERIRWESYTLDDIKKLKPKRKKKI